MHNFPFSFVPIPFKLYRCLDHALKVCTWFDLALLCACGLNLQIKFYHFFRNLNLVVFRAFTLIKSESMMGTLCAQILQFLF